MTTTPMAEDKQEMTHTAGPWKVLEGKYGLQIHGYGERCSHWIANLKCESCPAHEEGNAHLIAASPDLYEALEPIKWQSADKDNMEFSAKITFCQMDNIRAALRKAKGEDNG